MLSQIKASWPESVELYPTIAEPSPDMPPEKLWKLPPAWSPKAVKLTASDREVPTRVKKPDTTNTIQNLKPFLVFIIPSFIMLQNIKG
jgi:hypothetical protein